MSIRQEHLLSPTQLRQLPKAELHRHLDCSMRLSTFRELAPQVGITVPESAADFSAAFLVTEPMLDLEAVLKKFLATQAVLHSEEILTRLTFETIEDAVADGIRILELRYAPTFINEGHQQLTFEKIHRAILRGVQLAREKKLPIAVGLICIVQRILPLQTCQRVIDFAIENKESFIGVDLADNEVGFDNRPFAPLFEAAKKAGLHVTIHSGEADVAGAPEYVLNAIRYLGAERIGHGLQIFKSPEVMAEVKRLQIPLEICPTSNWLTNAVPSKAAHPIRTLMENGIPVTINTDDPGVFNLDLTHEYVDLQSLHQFTLEEFTRCNDIAARASFIPLELKTQFWPRAIAST
jgi:adenosine deaminase